MGININELPADVKLKIARKAGIQREQILKVAANLRRIRRAAGDSTQGLELALKGLKLR
jgi:ribosomal protein L6P/L9E